MTASEKSWSSGKSGYLSMPRKYSGPAVISCQLLIQSLVTPSRMRYATANCDANAPRHNRDHSCRGQWLTLPEDRPLADAGGQRGRRTHP